MEIIKIMNTKQTCPTCGQNTSEREIALYRGLVNALWRVYKWSMEKKENEFTRKDIKHLFVNENDTARFGDWVMFGGLVYKQGKGRYGLNTERCDQFFKGDYKIPTRIWKNPITRELRKEEYKSVGEIPSILSMLNDDREYTVRYRNEDYNKNELRP